MLSKFRQAIHTFAQQSGIQNDYGQPGHNQHETRSVLSRSISFRGRFSDNYFGSINSNDNNSDKNTPRNHLDFYNDNIGQNLSGTSSPGHNGLKFRYWRPVFLQLKTEDEIIVSADQQIRPIILPRDTSRLPWNSGYAETINAGKSQRNEDQAHFYCDNLIVYVTPNDLTCLLSELNTRIDYRSRRGIKYKLQNQNNNCNCNLNQKVLTNKQQERLRDRSYRVSRSISMIETINTKQKTIQETDTLSASENISGDKIDTNQNDPHDPGEFSQSCSFGDDLSLSKTTDLSNFADSVDESNKEDLNSRLSNFLDSSIISSARSNSSDINSNDEISSSSFKSEQSSHLDKIFNKNGKTNLTNEGTYLKLKNNFDDIIEDLDKKSDLGKDGETDLGKKDSGDSAATKGVGISKTGISMENDSKLKNTIDSDSSLNEIDGKKKLPWVYFGIFDGHAGSAVAVAAANTLHQIIAERLQSISLLLMALSYQEDQFDNDDDDESEVRTDVTDLETAQEVQQENQSNIKKANSSNTSQLQGHSTLNMNEGQDKFNSKLDDVSDKPPSTISINRDQINGFSSFSDLGKRDCNDESERKNNHFHEKQVRDCLSLLRDLLDSRVTIDNLIVGALESSFWAMDELIGHDKDQYKMSGGCTAIVAIFILGKLYVSNAGDSRAIVYKSKSKQVIPMSFDFTPNSERERIKKLGLQCPQFLGNEFTHLEFFRKPTKYDLGKQMLYKDAFMTGWSYKTITHDDLKFPLVYGEGKRSRLLATIGVTRGFGDHELRTKYTNVQIKPFLTPEPEVKILPLDNCDDLTDDDVLIMGTDGLWDVTTNEAAAEIVQKSFDQFLDNGDSKYRYISAAQDLVVHARGRNESCAGWQAIDDISVFVVPLKPYREEYRSWKKSRTPITQSFAQLSAKTGMNYVSD